jgi:hypothetical protein
MTLPYYRLPLALVASLSLFLAACGSNPSESDAVTPTAPPPPQHPDADRAGEIDTESTIWTVLGIASKPSQAPTGPQTGPQVSPVLWEATHDTLNFVKISAEDPDTGVLETDWYSPPGKTDERLRVSVFVMSRALRSDSVSVTVERQVRTGGGQWQQSTVDRDVMTELETAILLRARHIHAERYANRNYKQ